MLAASAGFSCSLHWQLGYCRGSFRTPQRTQALVLDTSHDELRNIQNRFTESEVAAEKNDRLRNEPGTFYELRRRTPARRRRRDGDLHFACIALFSFTGDVRSSQQLVFSWQTTLISAEMPELVRTDLCGQNPHLLLHTGQYDIAQFFEVL